MGGRTGGNRLRADSARSRRTVPRDVFHFNDRQEDWGWDAVWQVATAIEEEGWTAEFRIPLSQLRFAQANGIEQSWGINFGRQVARCDEASFWSPWLPTAPGFVSSAGKLTGLQALGSPRRLELIPYAVGRITQSPAPPGDVPSPFWRPYDPGFSLGADLKYGIDIEPDPHGDRQSRFRPGRGGSRPK